MQKKYNCVYERFDGEQAFEPTVYYVHSFNHLLSAGVNVQFHPRISAGAEYEFVYNSGKENNAFASQYVLFNLTTAVYQNSKMHINAFTEYGLPLTAKALQVHQINFGVRVRLFSFEF